MQFNIQLRINFTLLKKFSHFTAFMHVNYYFILKTNSLTLLKLLTFDNTINNKPILTQNNNFTKFMLNTNNFRRYLTSKSFKNFI